VNRFALLTMTCLAVAATGCDDAEGAWAGDAGSWSEPPPGRGGWDASSGFPASDAGAFAAPPMDEPPPPEGDPDAGPEDLCANRETMEPVVLYLSADDSNSMASPAIARNQILMGQRPSGHYLRTYEFLNYYNVRYAHPEPGDVTVVPELRTTEEDDELVLQVGVQSAPQPARRRVITLVLDTSGSMSGSPIERLRESCLALASQLRAGDVVSIVEWNTARTVPLEALEVSGPDDPRLLAAIRAVDSGGGTDLSAGLRFGYELADRHYDPEALNRVVLISDGRANVGVTDEELIAEHSEDAEQAGIFLVGVGVGDGVNDTLMDTVTDAGRGAYLFIDTADEARRMFADRFDEVMEVALMEVRVELTLPWYMAVIRYSAEEISDEAKLVRPQHLAPDDAMVFHQTLQSCDADAMSFEDTITARATFIRPEGRVAADRTVETTMADLLEQPDVGLARGDAIVAWAEALADIATGISRAETNALLDDVVAACAQADPDGTDPALTEIAMLADTLRPSL